MKFIRLTTTQDSPIWVNFAHVADMAENHQGGTTLSLSFSNGNEQAWFGVKETVEEILACLPL